MIQLLQKIWAYITMPILLIGSIFYLKHTAKKEAKKDIEIEQAKKTLDIITEIKQDDEKRMAVGGIDAVNKRLHKDAVD